MPGRKNLLSIVDLNHENLLLQENLARTEGIHWKSLEHHDIDPRFPASDESLGISVDDVNNTAPLKIDKLADDLYPFWPLPVRPPPFNLLLILR